MKNKETTAKDTLYKRGFGIGAALAAATFVGSLAVQSGYEDRVEGIKDDPDKYCTDLVRRKTVGAEVNDNQKAQYVDECRNLVAQLPEQSTSAKVLKPVAGVFGVASLGMFGLWGNHRRKNPDVKNEVDASTNEPG